MVEVRVRVAAEIDKEIRKRHAEARRERHLPKLSLNTYLSEVLVGIFSAKKERE